jgi:hypothetical protein
MLALATTLGASPAFAQVNPYDEPVLEPAPGVPAAPTPTIVAPAPEPINPYTLTPPPPPVQAPVYAPPPAYPVYPPVYQPPRQGYYVYPAPSQPPAYYVPAPRPVCCRCPPPSAYGYRSYGCRPPVAPYIVRRLPAPAPVPQIPHEWVRRFSLGVDAVVLGVNQSVGTNNVTMGGAGIHLRIRSQGRFGFELSTAYMQTDNFWNGNWQRKSLPFTAGLMLYIFPNTDARHFNIYGIAGVGAMYDMINLRDENNAKVEQDFLEWMAFAGAGLELRWKWFAISADYRFNGMWRDNSGTPASYYNGVSGGPVPSSSYGHMGKASISFWF